MPAVAYVRVRAYARVKPTEPLVKSEKNLKGAAAGLGLV